MSRDVRRPIARLVHLVLDDDIPSALGAEPGDDHAAMRLQIALMVPSHAVYEGRAGLQAEQGRGERIGPKAFNVARRCGREGACA